MGRLLKNCAASLGAIAIATFVIVGQAQIRPSVPDARVAISPQALSATPPSLVDKSALDPIDAKMHASLRAALNARAQGLTWTAASSLPAALRRSDEVLVEIRSLDSDENSADAMFARHGVTLRNAMGPNLHEAWVPIDRLRELAGDASVVRIAPARLVKYLATPTISEGVAAGNADYWQKFNPTYTGNGIKIALIDSYYGTKIASLQFSGDWPPNTRLTCFDLKNTSGSPPFAASSCTGSNFGSNNVAHGNATMELAYDIAPAATYRAYDTITVGDWYNAILDAANVTSNGNALGAVKANVISESLAAPLDGKGDGSALPGSIAQAAGYARARGVLVVNAAGNEQESHWGGLFKAATSPNTSFHTWNGTNSIYNLFGDGNGHGDCIADGETISVQVYWNNWVSSGASHDYDVYLYQGSGSNTAVTWNAAAQSTNTQNGGANQTPQEFIQYTASGGALSGCPAHSAFYSVAVVRVAGTTSFDNLQVFASGSQGEGLYYSVSARSLDFPADSPNVLSVAAIDVANNSTDPQEPFSSEGPVLATGGGLPTANASADPNLKPNLASFDHVSTVSYGPSDFYGTSAATPHVAGMAALFMQRFGIPASAAALDSTIINPLRAIAAIGSNDLGAAGKDYSYGYGRLRFQRDATLNFLQQPSNTLVNSAIMPAIKVGIYDGEGKLDSYTLFGSLMLAIAYDPNGGTAGITGNSASFVSGVATFNAAKINLGGSRYTLNAVASNAATPPINLIKPSNAFNITTGTPQKLVFMQQPTSVYAGQPITPSVIVNVEDVNNNLVNMDNTTKVTLIRTTCTGQVPVGGGPVTVTAGVAAFPNLTLYALASNAQLQATATSLSSATSRVFNVNKNTDIFFRNGFESCSP